MKPYSCRKHGASDVVVKIRTGKPAERRCRICSAEATQRYRLQRATCHPEKARVGTGGECKACWYKARPAAQAKRTEHARWRNIKIQYGLTREQYRQMHDAQAGLCAICNKPQPPSKAGRPRQLCVDHDHASGRVRRLLCITCNIVVGHAENTPGLLAAVTEYLNARA